jgi:cyclopropane fatty-acyl-phospholipid synthase-like methyltransferase
MNNSLEKSLDIPDERITPFIPFLLQDLWTLGGNPNLVVELLKRNISITSNFQMIDLGCGKGATLFEMYKNFPANYTGIDLVPEFIAEGIKKIEHENLSSSMTLKAEDFIETLKQNKKYDLIIYGYDSDVLGTICETLLALKAIKKSNGYIVFESAFKHEEYEGKEYPSKTELFRDIDKSGLDILDFALWNKEFLRATNKQNNDFIKQRVEQLKIKHPNLSQLYDDFYRIQIGESKILDEYIECVAFLLK